MGLKLCGSYAAYPFRRRETAPVYLKKGRATEFVRPDSLVVFKNSKNLISG